MFFTKTKDINKKEEEMGQWNQKIQQRGTWRKPPGECWRRIPGCPPSLHHLITRRHMPSWAWSELSSVLGLYRKSSCSPLHAQLGMLSPLHRNTPPPIILLPDEQHLWTLLALWDIPTTVRPPRPHSRSCQLTSSEGPLKTLKDREVKSMPQNLCSVYLLELYLTVTILPFPCTDGCEFASEVFKTI